MCVGYLKYFNSQEDDEEEIDEGMHATLAITDEKNINANGKEYPFT